MAKIIETKIGKVNNRYYIDLKLEYWWGKTEWVIYKKPVESLAYNMYGDNTDYGVVSYDSLGAVEMVAKHLLYTEYKDPYENYTLKFTVIAIIILLIILTILICTK